MPSHPCEPFAADAVLVTILEASDDAIVCMDLAGMVFAWNRGAERIFGYGAAEMVGRSITTLVPPEKSEELADILRRVADGERVAPVDTERMTKSGHRVRVMVTMGPIAGAEHRPVGAVAMTRDVTAQRRAEGALQRSEARWRAIVEAAIDAVILIDRHGRIESFNAAAERMFGYRADETLGRNVSMLMPEPHAAEHDHYIRRYLMTGERRIIGIGREVTGRRRDGTTFPAHLSVGEVSLDGEPKFTGIVRDLTERVSLEVRLREEAGLVRVGELAAVLAHEVKNPLAAVSGAIQMLRDHLPSEEDQEIVGEILRRLDGLGSLMTDLLLYARPPRPVMRDIEVMDLLHALVAFLRSDPAWSGLDVSVEGSHTAVHADAELLKVAFQNLLLNAAQAVNGKGKVVVAVQSAAGHVLVDVGDSGPGIGPELREKLFTPFFTTKARGTGLGLPTVRRIAEAHGGQATILRSGSDGTVMRVRLPTVSSIGALA